MPETDKIAGSQSEVCPAPLLWLGTKRKNHRVEGRIVEKTLHRRLPLQGDIHSRYLVKRHHHYRVKKPSRSFRAKLMLCSSLGRFRGTRLVDCLCASQSAEL